MDKIAANQHFVLMMKEVKKAKAMVSGNLIRRVAKLKASKEKLKDKAQIKKIDAKISKLLGHIKQLKTLDSYTVAREATLRPGAEAWNKIISHSKATPEETLMARVIVKNNIQKQVNKFRSDQKDCDEWLNEYIEYREKKRQYWNPTGCTYTTRALRRRLSLKTT